jgi:hypothetical protein
MECKHLCATSKKPFGTLRNRNTPIDNDHIGLLLPFHNASIDTHALGSMTFAQALTVMIFVNFCPSQQNKKVLLFPDQAIEQSMGKCVRVMAICVAYMYLETCVHWFISWGKVTRRSLKTSPIHFAAKTKIELSIAESGAHRDGYTHTYGTTIHHEDSAQICFCME